MTNTISENHELNLVERESSLQDRERDLISRQIEISTRERELAEAALMRFGNVDPEALISIWSKAVDTQMHFNEMSVKSRQFGLGFVAAALGIGIVLLTRGEEFSIPLPLAWGGRPLSLHVTVLVCLASAFALHAVRILDLGVYHKMLRGAVAFGEDFEQNYMKKIFELDKGMTQAISHFSRLDDAGVALWGTRYRYLGDKKRSALEKIRRFYRFSIFGLVVIAVALFVATNSSVSSEKADGAPTSNAPTTGATNG